MNITLTPLASPHAKNKPWPEGQGGRMSGRGFDPAPLSGGVPPRPKGRGFPLLDEEHAKFIDFVNQHYLSPFPLTTEDIQSGKYIFFWAVHQQTRVGATGLMPKTPFLVETVKSVIHPSYRGKGLGVALSLAIEEEARNRGFAKVTTTIYVTNIPMITIKLKQGYLVEGLHLHHEKPGLHEYSLGKLLKSSS